MIGRTHRTAVASRSLTFCVVALVIGDLTAQEPAGVNVPLVNQNGDVGLTAAPGFGMDVSAKSIKGSTPDVTATRLTFNNPREQRRIAALAGVPGGSIEGARVLAFDCRLAMPQGPLPPIVALFFESDGGAWYRISTKAPPRSLFDEIRLPLRGTFKRARFATDSDETIRWEQVERVWLGLLVDGPTEGVIEVRRTRFTDELFRPDSPIPLGKTWDIAQDPAVQSKLDPAAQGPGDALMMEYRFDIPGGRHMYAMARTPVEVEELDAYSALRFTYQVDLPEGIDGLLVMLIERDGTQYRAVPTPPESGAWKTVTIPFDKFERGGWSKDENDQLDLEQVSHVAIGMHGTTPTAASATIKVVEVMFVP